MGLSDLQTQLTEKVFPQEGVEVVDLLKIANGAKSRKEQLKLVIDAECCLDRLYGGYFPDWVCGGQWNKMEQFLRNFASVVQNSNLDLIVFFNGSLEQERLETDWKKQQEETHRMIEEIHRHVTLKKKPPPKIWWISPAYLRSAVRLAFQTLHVKMMCTQDDHHKEVVRFCQRNNFQGVVADDPEYLVHLNESQRYFSAQKLKLTFKGSLETVEIKVKKIFETLNVPKERFHIFATLFGNHIVSETDLIDFYSSLNLTKDRKDWSFSEKLAEYIRGLESIEVIKIAEMISKPTAEKDSERGKSLSEKVIKSLRYYSDLNIPKSASATQKFDKKGKNKNQKKGEQKSVKEKPADQATSNGNAAALPSDGQKLEGDTAKVFSETEAELVVLNGIEDESTTEAETKSSLDKLMYRINPEIDNVATNRHKNGLMSPYICQIFRHKEIKLPAIIQESKDYKDLPRAHELFRPLRQRVYAILFNLHHLQFLAKQRNEKVPKIQVKESFYSPQTKSIKTEVVSAVEVGWGVPTVERLWLGEKDDCKRKRIRAFLTILKSDKPIILDSTCVPQQMLVLACVLRYILATEKKILRKNELEAFIAQAYIQDMTDPSIAQDIEVGNLTMRGVHLSHLFMEGVEMALLANDACGAPIPFMLFCPWLFFNGKVFNYVLEQQAQAKSLAEICGYKMDLVFNVDQLRLAVTEGIRVQYAGVPNPPSLLFANNALMNQMIAPPSRVQYMPSHLNGQGHASLSHLAAGNRNRLLGPGPGASIHSNPFFASAASQGCSMGGLYGNYPGALGGLGNGLAGHGRVPLFNDIPLRQRRVPARGGGGQLEVAGMVVGSWGANYGHNQSHLGNQLNVGGRPVRIPMGPGPYVSQNMQVNSLFDQMRISGGKGPNIRTAPQPVPWHLRKNTPVKPQKKQPAKKTSNTSNSTFVSGKAAGAQKGKGVSFQEESEKSQRKEIGAGDAQSLPSSTVERSQEGSSQSAGGEQVKNE